MLENNKINNLKPLFPTLPAKYILIFVLLTLFSYLALVLLFVFVYIYLIPLKSSHPFINNTCYEKHLKIFYFIIITYISIPFIMYAMLASQLDLLMPVLVLSNYIVGFFTLYFAYICKPFFKDRTSFLFINSRNFLELAKLNSNPISKFKNCIKGLQLYHNYLKNELKIKINDYEILVSNLVFSIDLDKEIKNLESVYSENKLAPLKYLLLHNNLINKEKFKLTPSKKVEWIQYFPFLIGTISTVIAIIDLMNKFKLFSF